MHHHVSYCQPPAKLCSENIGRDMASECKTAVFEIQTRATHTPPPPLPPRGPQGLINLHLLQVTANGNCSTSCTLYNIFNFSHTRLVHDIMPDHLWNLKIKLVIILYPLIYSLWVWCELLLNSIIRVSGYLNFSQPLTLHNS